MLRLRRAFSPLRLGVAALVAVVLLWYLVQKLTIPEGRVIQTDEELAEMGGVENAWRLHQQQSEQNGLLQQDQMYDAVAIHVPPLLEDAPATTSSPTIPVAEVTPVAFAYEIPQILDDAHRLPDPDAFHPHFDAITKLPAITFAEAKSGCQWPDLSKVNFQFKDGEESSELNTSWTTHEMPEEWLSARRDSWQQFVKSDLIPWGENAHRFEGRGIVIVGGSKDNMKRIAVTIKKLKKLGSRLPIELHYFAEELDEGAKQKLANLWPLLYFNDLAGAHNILVAPNDPNPFRPHFHLKTAALVNSRFAEPLLLDSDNIPALAPDSLWDSDVYREYGTIFWPDIARTRPDNPAWSITNTRCRMDEYEQESGQLLVDKRKFFYHLQLAAWMNAPKKDAKGEFQLSDYYHFLLGDKDTFRFAWHALKTKYGKPAKFLTSVGTVSGPDGFYCGHSFLQYHPDGRPLFMHGGLLKTMQKPVMAWQRREHGGIFQAYKKSDHETDHQSVIDVHLGWDAMEYLPDKSSHDLGVAWCTFFPLDVEARPLEELVPGFEKDFDEVGGYWPLDDPEAG